MSKNSFIFIGGFYNTGTRIIVNFLQTVGYLTKNANETQDYLGGKFLPLFNIYWKKKNSQPLIDRILLDFHDDNNAVVKHGHLCFLFTPLEI